jgi:hypothetical protein
MPVDIKESDWKIFRELHPLALERFCTRTMAEVERIVREKEGTNLEMYRAVYGLIERQDKELAFLFDDFRRSTALIQLAQLRARRLVTVEEMGRFSLESRKRIAMMLQAGGR